MEHCQGAKKVGGDGAERVEGGVVCLVGSWLIQLEVELRDSLALPTFACSALLWFPSTAPLVWPQVVLVPG